MMFCAAMMTRSLIHLRQNSRRLASDDSSIAFSITALPYLKAFSRELFIRDMFIAPSGIDERLSRLFPVPIATQDTALSATLVLIPDAV